MSETLSAAKQELRQRMVQKLRELSQETKAEAQHLLHDRLSEHYAFKRAQVVMMYMSMPTELSLNSCAQAAWDAGKMVVFPRVNGKDLEACRVNNLEGDLSAGAYHVLEPKKHCDLVQTEDIDLVFVPGVAFDRLGWRLGRGKGFYDRFLNSLPETCLTIGVCFKVQLLKSIPYGPNDICVKEVIAV